MINRLKNRLEEIKERAESSGSEKDIFYAITFEIYVKQIEIMAALEECIDKDGVIIKKQYVKNRYNICLNPALREYNTMIGNTNKLVSMLMRISKENDCNCIESDPLNELLGG